MSYVLDGHTPVEEPDLEQWARWFAAADRHVREDTVGDTRVSTVFLGIDHNFGFHNSRPVLFETMVFGGPKDADQDRYRTWDEAVAGHQDMLYAVIAIQD